MVAEVSGDRFPKHPLKVVQEPVPLTRDFICQRAFRVEIGNSPMHPLVAEANINVKSKI